MLWAQLQPRNEAEAAAFLIGTVIAGLFCGAIPFVTGLVMKQVPLAVAGGVVSAGAGTLAGCCAGIPVAAIFTIIIVVVASAVRKPEPRSPFDRPLQDDYDDYARPFQLPRRERTSDEIPWAKEVPEGVPDRRRESEADWRRRSEDEERYRARGFRPRRRDDDPDA